jgi:hypothetical protein
MMNAEIESVEISRRSQVHMGDVLGRVGHELSHLARLLAHLEILLGPLIVEAAGRDAAVLRHMQGFDHIGQKVSGLADFLAALAPAASDQWTLDPTEAARVVTLADLASRLVFEEDQNACATAGGDCELF